MFLCNLLQYITHAVSDTGKIVVINRLDHAINVWMFRLFIEMKILINKLCRHGKGWLHN